MSLLEQSEPAGAVAGTPVPASAGGLLTYPQAAQRLAISVRTLARLVSAGKIQVFRPGKALGSSRRGSPVRFQPVVLDKYIQKYSA